MIIELNVCDQKPKVEKHVTFKVVEEEKKLDEWRLVIPRGYPEKIVEGDIVEEQKHNSNLDIILGRIPTWMAPYIKTSSGNIHYLYNDFVLCSMRT